MVGETELLLGGRAVVGTDNSRTYFEFTSFPPWLAAFLAIARLDWLDIVGGGTNNEKSFAMQKLAGGSVSSNWPKPDLADIFLRFKVR